VTAKAMIGHYDYRLVALSVLIAVLASYTTLDVADLEIPDDFGRLSQELETAIFRIVQESVTNIHRHSGNPVARIHISRSDSELRVEVEDKGKGIPLEKRSAMASTGMVGVGIRGMRERIRQLGGTLEIKSGGHGRGTLIVARLGIGKTPPIDIALRGHL
jgi:signal transduction histidine kinase